MRYLSLAVALAFSCMSLSAQSTEQIGEEVIKPIAYPKYNFHGVYSNLRWGSLDNKITLPLQPIYGGAIGFDVGLYKYLNAGAMLSTYLGNIFEGELTYARLTLFARPQITFFDRLSIFARLGGGPSVSIGYPASQMKKIGSDDVKKAISKDYGFQTEIINAGAHGVATIGIEYFPFSRVGIALEWGLSADYIFNRRTPPSSSEADRIEKKKRDGTLTKEDVDNYNKELAGRSYGFFSYEMPIMLTLSIIL